MSIFHPVNTGPVNTGPVNTGCNTGDQRYATHPQANGKAVWSITK
jgi:hypothetical protein